MPQIKKQVPKWAPFRKQLFLPDWTSYNKIWMTDFQGGNLLARKNIFAEFSIPDKLLFAKKRPRFGIKLPDAVDDNQSCHIFTVLFN